MKVGIKVSGLRFTNVWFTKSIQFLTTHFAAEFANAIELEHKMLQMYCGIFSDNLAFRD